MSQRKRFNNNTGMGQVIDASIAACPEREAIVFHDWRITYGQLGSLVYQTAHKLRDWGLRRGETAAIITRNCPEFLILEFAMYKIGVIPVKINWRLLPAEMSHMLEKNHASFAFFRAERPEWGARFHELCANKTTVFELTGSGPEGSLLKAIQDAPDTPVNQTFSDNEPACHVHTSGTTGHAKCAVYTHGAMLDEIESVVDLYGYEDGQRCQFIAQLFHSGGIGALLCLCTRGTLILMEAFSAELYMESLIREQVTAISVVPTVLKWILDEMDVHHYDLHTLKVIRYSTCPIPPALLQRAMEKLDCAFYQSYGMTEMGSIVTTLQPEDHLKAGGAYLTTVGRPIPGAQVAIMDPDGRLCEAKKVGEICVKGPGCMKEYLGQPDLTQSRFTAGWYHTGDMGYLDWDGYLTISGRADDLIISGGENIYPGEIVNVLMQLNDDISEAAVYGVPDEIWGEHVKASIVLVPGSRMTTQEIWAYCKANMPHYRVPKEIEILEELPKNPTGKVLLGELKHRRAPKGA